MAGDPRDFYKCTQSGDKIVVTQGTTSGNPDDWLKVFQDITVPSNANGIWLPNQQNPDWTLGDFIGPAVKARCYNRNCKNDALVVTELKLGPFLNLKTYICDSCLKDLADKVKSELGVEDLESTK